jgi:hypothetical protein
MAFGEFSYNIETLSYYFQGGVRKSILIFGGVCVVLLAPFFFLGTLASNLYSNSSLNPTQIQLDNFVNPKVTKDVGYVVDRTQLVPLDTGETVLYTTINNKQNETLGYNPFVYKVQVLDQNQAVIDETIEESYLLPDDIKYIIANPKNDKGVDLRVITDPKTVQIPFNPNTPNVGKNLKIETRNPSVTDTSDGKQYELKATLKNNDIVDVKNLDLLYIVRDSLDRVVGIGEFRLQRLASGEEWNFYAQYPKPKFRRGVKLEIRPQVNYLNPGNFVLR